ncbi:MAG: hypothetical protein AAFN40_22805 [Cyanobacteria bacterium J06560_6]
MNAMEVRRQQMLDNVQALPDDFLEEALEYLSKLRRKARALGIERTSGSVVGSTYKALEQAGMIGYVKDGPSDLSVNHKKYITEYLEGKYPLQMSEEIQQPSLQEIARLPVNERHQLFAQQVVETAKDFANDPVLTEFSEIDLGDWGTDDVGA